MKRILSAIVMAVFVLTNSGTSFALRTPATAEAKGKDAGLKDDLRAAAQALSRVEGPAQAAGSMKMSKMVLFGNIVRYFKDRRRNFFTTPEYSVLIPLIRIATNGSRGERLGFGTLRIVNPESATETTWKGKERTWNEKGEIRDYGEFGFFQIEIGENFDVSPRGTVSYGLWKDGKQELWFSEGLGNEEVPFDAYLEAFLKKLKESVPLDQWIAAAAPAPLRPGSAGQATGEISTDEGLKEYKEAKLAELGKFNLAPIVRDTTRYNHQMAIHIVNSAASEDVVVDDESTIFSEYGYFTVTLLNPNLQGKGRVQILYGIKGQVPPFKNEFLEHYPTQYELDVYFNDFLEKIGPQANEWLKNAITLTAPGAEDVIPIASAAGKIHELREAAKTGDESAVRALRGWLEPFNKKRIVVVGEEGVTGQLKEFIETTYGLSDEDYELTVDPQVSDKGLTDQEIRDYKDRLGYDIVIAKAELGQYIFAAMFDKLFKVRTLGATLDVAMPEIERAMEAYRESI